MDLKKKLSTSSSIAGDGNPFGFYIYPVAYPKVWLTLQSLDQPHLIGAFDCLILFPTLLSSLNLSQKYKSLNNTLFLLDNFECL